MSHEPLDQYRPPTQQAVESFAEKAKRERAQQDFANRVSGNPPDFLKAHTLVTKIRKTPELVAANSKVVLNSFNTEINGKTVAVAEAETALANGAGVVLRMELHADRLHPNTITIMQKSGGNLDVDKAIRIDMDADGPKIFVGVNRLTLGERDKDGKRTRGEKEDNLDEEIVDYVKGLGIDLTPLLQKRRVGFSGKASAADYQNWFLDTAAGLGKVNTEFVHVLGIISKDQNAVDGKKLKFLRTLFAETGDKKRGVTTDLEAYFLKATLGYDELDVAEDARGIFRVTQARATEVAFHPKEKQFSLMRNGERLFLNKNGEVQHVVPVVFDQLAKPRYEKAQKPKVKRILRAEDLFEVNTRGIEIQSGLELLHGIDYVSGATVDAEGRIVKRIKPPKEGFTGFMIDEKGKSISFLLDNGNAIKYAQRKIDDYTTGVDVSVVSKDGDSIKELLLASTNVRSKEGIRKANKSFPDSPPQKYEGKTGYVDVRPEISREQSEAIFATHISTIDQFNTLHQSIHTLMGEDAVNGTDHNASSAEIRRVMHELGSGVLLDDERSREMARAWIGTPVNEQGLIPRSMTLQHALPKMIADSYRRTDIEVLRAVTVDKSRDERIVTINGNRFAYLGVGMGNRLDIKVPAYETGYSHFYHVSFQSEMPSVSKYGKYPYFTSPDQVSFFAAEVIKALGDKAMADQRGILSEAIINNLGAVEEPYRAMQHVFAIAAGNGIRIDKRDIDLAVRKAAEVQNRYEFQTLLDAVLSVDPSKMDRFKGRSRDTDQFAEEQKGQRDASQQAADEVKALFPTEGLTYIRTDTYNNPERQRVDAVVNQVNNFFKNSFIGTGMDGMRVERLITSADDSSFEVILEDRDVSGDRIRVKKHTLNIDNLARFRQFFASDVEMNAALEGGNGEYEFFEVYFNDRSYNHDFSKNIGMKGSMVIMNTKKIGATPQYRTLNARMELNNIRERDFIIRTPQLTATGWADQRVDVQMQSEFVAATNLDVSSLPMAVYPEQALRYAVATNGSRRRQIAA